MFQTLPTDRPLTQEEIENLVLQEYVARKTLTKKTSSFLEFVRHVSPWVVVEEIHCLIADRLDKLVSGEIDRLMFFIAPRTGKSLFASTLFPAYYIGHFADRQIMQIGHNSDLSQGFGRDARNLLMTDSYTELFPATQLSKDSRGTSSWATTQNGKYVAAGVGSGIAGKGWHLGVADDLISEQDAYSKTAKNFVWNWWGPGFYSRQMPEQNAIVMSCTRWAVDDPAGRLLAQAVVDPDADQWEVVSIPAVLDEESADTLTEISHNPKYRKYLATEEYPDPIDFKAGDSFSPRRWPLKKLLRIKGNMTKKAWAALYMQKPYDDEGGILPREQWRKWKFDAPPKCVYVVQFYDTAFEPEEVNDFSARTTWGIFKREEDGKYCCILLERYNQRPSFPDLRREAYDSYLEYSPDRVLIEKKASGHSLLQELRRKDVPIKAMKVRDSKTARAHAASIVLEQGCVYYMDRAWADEVIDQCAEFPSGPHDDLVDTCTGVWNFMRRTFWLQLGDEEDEDPGNVIQERKRHWYLRQAA